MLISLRTEQNVDCTRTSKLKDVDFMRMHKFKYFDFTLNVLILQKNSSPFKELK